MGAADSFKVDKDKAKNLLSGGVEYSLAAKILGCDVSYLSHLMADPEFAAEVTARQVANAGDQVQITRKVTELQLKALEKIERLLPFESDLSEIRQCFKVLNSATLRTPDVNPDAGKDQQVVTLRLPQAIALNFKVDINNEVIQAGEQALVTMPSQMLLQMAMEKGHANGQALEKLAGRLGQVEASKPVEGTYVSSQGPAKSSDPHFDYAGDA